MNNRSFSQFPFMYIPTAKCTSGYQLKINLNKTILKKQEKLFGSNITQKLDTKKEKK